VAISMGRPYAGWDRFKGLIQKCVNALLETPFVAAVERCSIKYTNVLSEGQHINDLGQLKVGVQLDGFDLHNAATAVKAEIALGGCTNIINVITGATIKVAGIQPIDVSGVLVDVDSIKMGPFNNFASHLSDLLDQIHDTEKGIFFGLLTSHTLNKLGPEW
jgi:uncharacterized protein (TIGR04255 family)